MKNKVINLFENHKVVQNKEVKYSALLEKFMARFTKDFTHIEYIEDIFELSIHAWNFGNLKVIVPNDEFDQMISSVPEMEKDIILLKKMIDYKANNFEEYTSFIVDYDLKGTDKEPKLEVMAQGEESYLAEFFSNVEEQIKPEDLEQNYIDRHAIVIKPRQPFLDWINKYEQGDDIKEVNIYLVSDKMEDLETYLKKKFDKFFMQELDDWNTNKKQWPQRRNYTLFKQWFQVETATFIYDLEKIPVSKLDY